MKLTKRFLSILLVLCMVLSVLPTIGLTAGAASGDTYELVTNVSSLKAGDTVIIAAVAYNYALSTTQNTNNRGQVAITKSNNTISYTDGLQELTLESGTATGSFSFNTGSGYLYAASSGSNYLKTNTTKDANGSWAITISSDGTASIVAQGANTRNTMQYNTSGLFACYSSASQKAISIYKKAPSVVTYNLAYSENGKVSQTDVYESGADVSLKVAEAVTGYTFIGWSTKAVPTPTDTKPTTLITSHYTMPSADTTLYAVYAKATEGTGTSYSKTDIGNIQAADKVVITAKTSDGTLYAMSNNNGTSSPSAVDTSGGVGDTVMWNILNLGGDLIIYPNGTTGSWLYCTNSNTGVKVGTNENKVFQIDSDSGYLKNVATGRYLGVYASTPDWRCYTTSTSTNIANQTLGFYVKAATYTGYTTAPVVPTPATVNIRCGEGEASLLKNGEVIASVNTAGTPAQTYVTAGDEIVLVMKPASGYRLAAAEKGTDRILDSASASSAYSYKWYWNETLGAYTYTYTVAETGSTTSANYYNVSFLPRRMDTGFTAVQAASLTEGLYVITGVPTAQNTTPGSSASNNLHDPADTYLLFGDDGLAGDVVGRKSAALKLSDINVTLSNASPYRMAGLNEACLYEIKAGTGSYAGYYTIRMCGASTNLYLACTGDKNAALEAVSSLSDNAYWTISIDSNGVAKIQNKNYTNRYLKFMANGDFQFRTYQETTSGSTWPVLYKASQTGYIVSFGKTGSGTVSAYNTTASSDVVSGSVQSAGNNIRFTFTPATNYELTSVKLNGTAIALSDLTYDAVTGSYSYTYSGLNQQLSVTAVFGGISSSINVEYYVNNTKMKTVTADVEGEFYYVDLTPSVTIEGTAYTYADLSFDKAFNASSETEWSDVNEPIPVRNGDTVKLYFLTTAVSMSKTASETTKYVSSAGNSMLLGGTTEGSKAFTSANKQDTNENVKQTFQIELDVNSTDMIKGYSKGGNTDIILVLDDSNSMFPEYSKNAEVAKLAIAEFLKVAFTKDSGNKVAVVRYNSLAGAWNGSTFVECNGTATGYSGLTYANCFMSTKTAVTAAVNAALTQDNDNGGTNTEGGFMMAEAVARTRSASTDRDLLILIFTDGEPTFRYSDGSTLAYDNSGILTSEYEYNEALAAGQSLRGAIDAYSKCKSSIYSVALLNESSYTDQDYTLVENLMGTSPKKFVSDAASGYYYYTLLGRVNTASNWTSTTAYSNAYFAIKSDDASVVQQELEDVFKQIAYTTVPDQYLTGTLVDTIPAGFKLTDASKTALQAAGWTVTLNSDGTTTISKTGVVADNKSNAKDLTYEVEYQGGGYGAVYTNTSARFTYTDILTGNEVVGTFTKPVVEVIPWTVNDYATAILGSDLSISIQSNDLFAELNAGGYTVVDYQIRLTDKNGNDKTYFDAVEQLGDKFDAVLNTSNQTVNFYTLTGGTHTFYYVVEAIVKAPDKTTETVSSRVTKVEVTVANVDLTKTAQEVTNNTTYAADVTTDGHGNVHQLYLITLKVAKQSSSDTIKNGVLKDTIPDGFQFVRFVTPTSGVTHESGVITYSGISGNTTLQFLVRYTGTDGGVLYTNASASFGYDFGTSDDPPHVTQYFKQPVAGINPSTVNDVDIVKSGSMQTVDVMANDLFTEDGMTLSDYLVSDKTVCLTDAEGNKLTQVEIDALGINPVVNSDGTITYTAPQKIGSGSSYEFYYVVEANVTLPNNSTYAANNSTTLTSRPTKVTIYSVEDQYIVVDFGLPTVQKAYGVTKDPLVAKNVSLTSLVSVSGLQGSSMYGTMSAESGMYSFCPTTTNFDAASYFSYTVKLEQSVYHTAERSVTGGVTVIPANNIYYEENFIQWEDAWTEEGTAVDEKQSVENVLYGYDSTYEPASGNAPENYSNGNEKSVTVSKDAYEADAYFTFTGTGFDIFSECGKNSGVIVAEVYPCVSKDNISGCKAVKVILMDTYLNSDVSYYQIPVVMCHDLDYNVYTVKIRAFYNAIFDHNYKAAATESKIREVLGLDGETELVCGSMEDFPEAQNAETRGAVPAVKGQYNVYIDAVHIYNPLGTLNSLSGIAYTAYSEANELNPTFTNINDTILDVNNLTGWEDTESGVDGALYITSGSEAGEDDLFDDQTIVCLGAGGTIHTETENGKNYLLDQDGNRIRYQGADVYVVDIERDDPTTAQAGKAFYYDNAEGEAIQLTRGQLNTLDIYCYENKYEAIGPENEVYLRNGHGLAFTVAANAHIQISAKMPFNSVSNAKVSLNAYYNGAWTTVAEIGSRTELYYDLTNYVNSDNTLIIKCVSSDPNAVLSLCNVKGTGTTGRLITFNSRTLVAAMNAFYPTAEEHTHSYTAVVTEPTCTEQGFTTHTCGCKDSYVDTYVNALGHAWDEGVVTLSPTATENGVMTYTCERCTETKTEVIEATGETPDIPDDEDKPCDGGDGCPSAQFLDVDGKMWYHESVDYVVTHKLMNGVDGGKFAPEGSMSRAMLVTVLWRYEGEPAGGENTFSDVPENEWYTEAVAWAAANGIVNGIGDGRFDPQGTVTREQMATILCRYAENRGLADTAKLGDLSGFPDEKRISAYATDAVAWAVGEGLLLGSDGMLLPQDSVTRAQVAAILMRFIENIVK